MAVERLTLAVETEPIVDAARAVEVICGAIVKRHGARFRDFERRLEATLEGLVEAPQLVPLEPGRLVATPGPRLTALLREAADLGLLNLA